MRKCKWGWMYCVAMSLVSVFAFHFFPCYSGCSLSHFLMFLSQKHNSKKVKDENLPSSPESMVWKKSRNQHFHVYMWSIGCSLCLPHPSHHALQAEGFYAHTGKPGGSSVGLSELCFVSPVSQIWFWGRLCLWGQAVVWKRRGVLFSKHIHLKVLLFCVSDISVVLPVVLEVFTSECPYSHPYAFLDCRRGRVNRDWGGCLHQMGYLCRSWPICSGPVPSLVVPLLQRKKTVLCCFPIQCW